jgi:hypothetical protein
MSIKCSPGSTRSDILCIVQIARPRRTAKFATRRDARVEDSQMEAAGVGAKHDLHLPRGDCLEGHKQQVWHEVDSSLGGSAAGTDGMGALPRRLGGPTSRIQRTDHAPGSSGIHQPASASDEAGRERSTATRIRSSTETGWRYTTTVSSAQARRPTSSAGCSESSGYSIPGDWKSCGDCKVLFACRTSWRKVRVHSTQTIQLPGEWQARLRVGEGKSPRLPLVVVL